MLFYLDSRLRGNDAAVRMACASIALFACLLTPISATAQTTLPAPVAKALAQAQIPENAAAFYVHEIGAERPLVAAGTERAMNPASTIKLVTTYAGL